MNDLSSKSVKIFVFDAISSMAEQYIQFSAYFFLNACTSFHDLLILKTIIKVAVISQITEYSLIPNRKPSCQ